MEDCQISLLRNLWCKTLTVQFNLGGSGVGSKTKNFSRLFFVLSKIGQGKDYFFPFNILSVPWSAVWDYSQTHLLLEFYIFSYSSSAMSDDHWCLHCVYPWAPNWYIKSVYWSYSPTLVYAYLYHGIWFYFALKKGSKTFLSDHNL